MFLKCILVQKVGFVKYKSGLLHGHKMESPVTYFHLIFSIFFLLWVLRCFDIVIGLCHSIGVQSLASHPETHLQSQTAPGRVYGWQSGAGTDFSPSTSVFSWHYQPTNLPNLLIHLSPTLFSFIIGKHC